MSIQRTDPAKKRIPRIDAVADDGWLEHLENIEDEAEERAEERPHVAEILDYVFTPQTLIDDGYIVPNQEDIYDINSKGAAKFNVEKFISWAKHRTPEKFMSTKPDDTVYIRKDNIYIPRAKDWIRAVMETCSDGEGVSEGYVTECANRLGRVRMVERSSIESKFPYQTPLNNGVLDTHTCKVSPYTDDIVALTKLDVDYDPNATCPEWIEFVEYVLGDDDAKTLQEMFGFCLMRKYEWQDAFFLLGTGSNGKSAAMKILEALLGRTNVSHVALQSVGERFFGHDLVGKFAQISGDTSAKAMQDATVFKMSTGQDWMRTEMKGKDAFDFKNFATMISLLNQLPESADQSDGFFNRFNLIRFDVTVGIERRKEKSGFEDYIINNEMSGVLNWAIEGLKRVWAQGKFTFQIGKTTADLRKAWNVESDHVKGFVEECCVVGGKGLVSTDVFMTAYGRWHEDKYGVVPAEVQGDITQARPWAGFHKPDRVRVKAGDVGIWFYDDGRDRDKVNCYKGICLKNTPGHLSVDMSYLAEHWDEIVGNSDVSSPKSPYDNNEIGGGSISHNDNEVILVNKVEKSDNLPTHDSHKARKQKKFDNLCRTVTKAFDDAGYRNQTRVSTSAMVKVYPGGKAAASIQKLLEEHKEALHIDNPDRDDRWVRK